MYSPYRDRFSIRFCLMVFFIKYSSEIGNQQYMRFMYWPYTDRFSIRFCLMVFFIINTSRK